jgi:hypothetical protein
LPGLPTSPVDLKKKKTAQKAKEEEVISTTPVPSVKPKGRKSRLGTARLTPDNIKGQTTKPHLQSSKLDNSLDMESKKKNAVDKDDSETCLRLVSETTEDSGLGGTPHHITDADHPDPPTLQRTDSKDLQSSASMRNKDQRRWSSTQKFVGRTTHTSTVEAAMYSLRLQSLRKAETMDSVDSPSVSRDLVFNHTEKQLNADGMDSGSRNAAMEKATTNTNINTFLTGDGMSVNDEDADDSIADPYYVEPHSDRSAEDSHFAADADPERFKGHGSLASKVSTSVDLGESLSSSVDSFGIRTILDIGRLETGITIVTESSGRSESPPPCSRFGDTSEVLCLHVCMCVCVTLSD